MLRKQALSLSLLALTVAGCATVVAQAQQNSAATRDALKQELEVMNSIFETKLAQQNEAKQQRRGHFRSQRLSYNYLAGQGVVYRVNFGRQFEIDFDVDFDFDFDAPMPPDAPMSEVIIERQVIEGDIEEVEMAYHQVAEAGLEVGDLVRDMHDKRRKVRDLEFALNSADGAGRKTIEEQLSAAKEQLAAARTKLEERKQALRAASSEIREKQAQRRAERAQKLQQQVATFEQTLADTLCTYGSTLKSLPNNEHISFVLQGAGKQDAGGRDKIYIFSKSSLVACQKNNAASDLLSQAVTYSF
ncbi:MAG: hypothetical protein GYB30_07030 [Gammaproteobacteria bacterium]|nr:hypothetical protein [Gammaproteobacteria bacterium]